MSCSYKSAKGFLFSATKAGLKKSGNLDLALIFSKSKASAAAVFTKNAVKAAPIYISMENVKNGHCQAVIVNSGNANAATGEPGLEDAQKMAFYAAQCLNLDASDVVVASTGVIGERLNIQKIKDVLPNLCHSVEECKIDEFSRAIMTTDTFPKLAQRTIMLGEKEVIISGVAKGSGMIMPNMATMLGFIMTDAEVDHRYLNVILKERVSATFNRVTVDGDTSTNDMVLLMANGESGAKKVLPDTHEAELFCNALHEVMYDLSVMLAKDGEGATKLIKVITKGAKSESDAENVSRAVANSPLVKTAFFGEDANVGRLMMALGNADAKIYPNEIDIYINDILIVKSSLVAGDVRGENVTNALKGKEISVTVDLNVGQAMAEILTCDFSYDYVKINSEYTT